MTEPQKEIVMPDVRQCIFCGYQTNIKGDLAKHVKAKHPSPYPKWSGEIAGQSCQKDLMKSAPLLPAQKGGPRP